jgi:hypothetical protein
MAGETQALPPSIGVNVCGARPDIWAASTGDPRALQKGATPDRLAACWYATCFSVGIVVRDRQPHRLALYFLDWDRLGRMQRVDLIDNSTGRVVWSHTLTDFADGKYLVLDLQASVTIAVTNVKPSGPGNAVLSGVFIGGPSTDSAPVPAEVISLWQSELPFQANLNEGIKMAAGLSEGQFVFRLSGEAGTAYVVEVSADLVEWTNVGIVAINAEGWGEMIDGGALAHEQRYYRILPASP